MGSDERDELLTAHFAGGDDDVLGELLARHRPRVRAALNNRIPNHMQRSREATKKLYGRAFVRFKRVFDEMFPRSTASPPTPESQTDE